LLFKSRFHPALRDGSITLTFRSWKRPQARAGGRYRFGPDDVLVVDSIARVRAGSISDADARRSGFATADELRAELDTNKPASVYRIAFHYEASADPRMRAARNDRLTPEDVESISARLARMDRSSRNGAWTLETLRLIARCPFIAASNLAAELDRERAAFKANVRKLKSIGLTISHETGYELSPRGEAYLTSK
jgi:biotin operon repressor